MINDLKTLQWHIRETEFQKDALGKCEAMMALGNGYMGLRSVMEEPYLGETRNCFVAGTFDKFDKYEVTELPNAADITRIKIVLDGEEFRLDTGRLEAYSRELCLKNGELYRYVKWESPKGKHYELHFYRMVSLKRLHVIAQKVKILPQDADTHVVITTGINGKMTNSGTQHFSDREKRFYDQKYMQLLQETLESEIMFCHNTVVKLAEKYGRLPAITMERRSMFCRYELEAESGKTLEFEKISNIYTNRDRENAYRTVTELQEYSLAQLKEAEAAGYDKLLQESADSWQKKVWDQALVCIEPESSFDATAVRFAQYHMEIMAPSHDSRICIGAKGLSGEGYKGHTFWDMDIFNLPYYIYTMPYVARKLLEYRYLLLPAAKEKAKAAGYEGAWYPWESAWPEEGEVIPKWGAVNVMTGRPTRIWSGEKELHITADVAYGIWLYGAVTEDKDFMVKYGYEIIFETAKFWSSRLEYKKNDSLYHIRDVIGPDEYKEHVNDNSFTNYMAYWNIKKAMECCHLLREESVEQFERLNEQLGLDAAYTKWHEQVDKIYLPKPRKSDQVIPQDKTYLRLADVDLTKYKKQAKAGEILQDYSIDQISKMQVSKQADILMMFFLLEDMFEEKVKRANWQYYEKRTLHDSSLSLSTHCILACDMGEEDLAYELFLRSCGIDMGEDPHSSDEGIHAAAIGGIWQCVVYGFGGVRMVGNHLRIEPKLPKVWNRLTFELTVKGQKLVIQANHSLFAVRNETGKKQIEFWHHGRCYVAGGKQDCVVRII